MSSLINSVVTSNSFAVSFAEPLSFDLLELLDHAKSKFEGEQYEILSLENLKTDVNEDGTIEVNQELDGIRITHLLNEETVFWECELKRTMFGVSTSTKYSWNEAFSQVHNIASEILQHLDVTICGVGLQSVVAALSDSWIPADTVFLKSPMLPEFVFSESQNWRVEQHKALADADGKQFFKVFVDQENEKDCMAVVSLSSEMKIDQVTAADFVSKRMRDYFVALNVRTSEAFNELLTNEMLEAVGA